MRALILAAGRGRRLGADHPKCLLSFGGRTLLERHIAALQGVPVRVVVGFQQQAIRDHLGGRVEYVENPRWTQGSLYSLEAGLGGLDDDILIMDADVLFHPEIVRRLAASEIRFAFAADRRSDPSGEEMMVTVKDDRVQEVTRRPTRPRDWMGESVGFTLVGRALLPDLLAEIAACPDGDYEQALDRLVRRHPAVAVPVEVPWTEIDFPEDVERAKILLRELE